MTRPRVSHQVGRNWGHAGFVRRRAWCDKCCRVCSRVGGLHVPFALITRRFVLKCTCAPAPRPNPFTVPHPPDPEVGGRGGDVTYSLVAYPAKDNYEGRFYPLAWIDKVRRGRRGAGCGRLWKHKATARYPTASHCIRRHLLGALERSLEL